jgi:hypothetical protein
MPELNGNAEYQSRAEAERRLAAAAPDWAARDIHLEMAKNYDLLAADASGRATQLGQLV